MDLHCNASGSKRSKMWNGETESQMEFEFTFPKNGVDKQPTEY